MAQDDTFSISELKALSGPKLKELVGKSDITVTYKSKRIARLSKYSEAKPTDPAPPAGEQPSSLVPADILNLKNWTLMLPTGGQGDADNQYPKRLSIPNVFYVSEGGGVAFRTRADGVHSSGSKYPRTELREMLDENWTKAAWTNKAGIHTLELTEAITAVAPVKPHVVSAQIHSGADDVLQIRLEGRRLMVMYKDGQATETLDDSYVLGTRFDVKIVASGGRIKVYYNGTLKAELAVSGSGWFWKAGCYLQTNVSKGDKPDAFGEVVIYKMKVTHA